ncbi:MAG: DUF2510 domain-containing protein [Microbacteriaceae bacterium]
MTTEQTTRVVPAGWYQDPADDAKVRWWNGITWTEHVEQKPAGAGAAVAGALAIEGGSSDDVQIQQLERQFDPEMSRRASMAIDHRGPDTGTIPIQGVAVPRPKAPSTSTASAMLLAFIPLFTTVLSVVAAYVFFYVTATPLVFAAAVVLWIMGFLWAIGDSRALQTRGLPAPSALLALALPVVGPLIYLIVRRARVAGALPLLTFIGLLLVAVVLPVGLGVAGAVPTVSKALEVQGAVSNDLVGSGAATAVTCPPILEATAAGSVFTCDAVTPAGDTVNVWVSIDDEDGNFSWALSNR